MPKISDFDDCGHDSFGDFGRCLYKYTSCGPWVVAVLMNGTEIYYGDKEAWKLPMDTEVQCLRVGSIVEGSDVEVGPYDVEDLKEFSETIKQIDEECDFYWKRDNLDHFTVLHGTTYVGYIVCGWGDFTFEATGEKPPSKRTIAKVKKFCLDAGYCKEMGVGILRPTEHEKFKVPGTRLVIEFFTDDCCY